MSDDRQLRKDIDKLYRDLYDISNGTLMLVAFKPNSDLKSIYNEIDEQGNPLYVGSLDAILDYYGLRTINNRVTDLENRVDDLE